MELKEVWLLHFILRMPENAKIVGERLSERPEEHRGREGSSKPEGTERMTDVSSAAEKGL